MVHRVGGGGKNDEKVLIQRYAEIIISLLNAQFHQHTTSFNSS